MEGGRKENVEGKEWSGTPFVSLIWQKKKIRETQSPPFSYKL